MNEIKIHSLNFKETTVFTWMEYEFLNVYHLIPSDIREVKWQEFLQDQLIEHRIADIREKIVDTAIANVLEKYHLKKKLFEFTSQCSRVVWLHLFDWVFSRLHSYLKRDATGKAMHLIVDIEPQPLPMDSWTFGNVSQIITQKSSFLRTFISPLPLMITVKSLNKHAIKMAHKR